MKHLIRLYPKAWRDRYGAELAAFLERRRATIDEAIDLLRGALDARLHPGLAQQLVFVPEIGFRPAGTRVLLERVATSLDGTAVTIVAVAAGPDRTDLLFEWEPPEEQEGPENWVLKIDRSGVHERPPVDLDAALVVGGDAHAPVRVEHRFRSAGGFDILDMTFPEVSASARGAELRITHGKQEWCVPFRLARSDFVGGHTLAGMEHEGIVLRATAVARRNDQVVVALEARTNDPRKHVWLMGSGTPPGFPAKLKAEAQGKIAHPLVLHDDHGRRSEELRRLHHVSRLPDQGFADPWPLRITSIFDSLDPHTKLPVLTVPSMLIGEQTESVVVDLRVLPVDIQLGTHRLRVLHTELSPLNRGRTRIVFQFFEPAGPRHFLGPASLRAHGWPGDHSFRGEPDERQRMWMDPLIPDLPIVTVDGALVRVDGPWTLPLSPD